MGKFTHILIDNVLIMHFHFIHFYLDQRDCVILKNICKQLNTDDLNESWEPAFPERRRNTSRAGASRQTANKCKTQTNVILAT